MLFPERLHCEPARAATAEILARFLTQQTWTLCQAFAIGDLVFLNDSTSEDGASEWAVHKDGQQLESITFSWCTEEEALSYIQRLQAGTLGRPYKTVAPRYHPKTQPCAACA